MEWLLTLLPVGLVVLVCGGMHMLMMRGMHSGHDAAAGHGGPLAAADHDNDLRPERPIKLVRRSELADANDVDRVAELENQVASLQQEIDAMLAYPRRKGNGSSIGRIAAPHHSDVARRNDSRPRRAQGELDDDGN